MLFNALVGGGVVLFAISLLASAEAQAPIAPVPPVIEEGEIFSTNIEITWGVVDGATSYTVYRNGANRGTTTDTSFIDYGLTPNTEYTFRVVAHNSAGQTANSAFFKVSTTSAPTSFSAPAPTYADTQTAIEDGTISIEKNNSRDDQIDISFVPKQVGVYSIEYGAFNTETVSVSSGQTDIRKVVPPITIGYGFDQDIIISFREGTSDLVEVARAHVTTVPTPTPTPRVTDVTSTSITIEWDAVAGAGYDIFRNGVEQITITGSSYHDDELDPETTYTYTIRPNYINNTVGPTSAPLVVTTLELPPATPALVLGEVTDTSIALSWGAVDNADSYTLTRIVAGGNIVVVSSNVLTAIDTGLAPATDYKYVIVATNTAGTSTPSAEFAASTTAAPIDTTPPVITVTPEEITLELNSPAPTLLTGVETDDGSAITISGTVDVTTVNDYTITYSSTDGTNPAVDKTRIYKVTDTIPPVITVTPEEITLELNSPAPTLLTGVETDDGSAITISGTVDVTTVNDYTITYSSTDGTNPAVDKTRIYKVTDTIPPVITVTPEEITLELNSPAPTLLTGVETDDGSAITISGTVDVTTVNDYTITYSSTDGTNPAVDKTRIYKVTAAPVPIQLNTIQINQNANVIDISFVPLLAGTFDISYAGSTPQPQTIDSAQTGTALEFSVTLDSGFAGNVCIEFDGDEISCSTIRIEPDEPTLVLGDVTHDTIGFTWNSVNNGHNYILTRVIEGTDKIVVEGINVLAGTDDNLEPETEYTYVISVSTPDGDFNDEYSPFSVTTLAAPATETPAIEANSFEVTNPIDTNALLVEFVALKAGTFTITAGALTDTVDVTDTDVTDAAVKSKQITVNPEFDGDVILSFDDATVASTPASLLAIRAGSFSYTGDAAGDVTVSFVPLRAGTFTVEAGDASDDIVVGTGDIGNTVSSDPLSLGNGFDSTILILLNNHVYLRPSVLTLPGIPTLEVETPTHNSVTLSWNRIASATGYVLSRTSGGATTEISVTGISYADTLEPETTYIYSIRTVAAAGDSAASNVVSVTTLAAPTDTTPPAAPVLSAGTTTDTTISLSWTAVDNADSYTLTRIVDGINDVEVATGDILTATDTGLSADTDYKYTITATNTAGTSDPSAEFDARTDAANTNPSPAVYTLNDTPHATDGDKVVITFTSSHTGDFTIEFDGGRTIDFTIDDAAVPYIHTETVGYDYNGNIIISIAGGAEVARESVTTEPENPKKKGGDSNEWKTKPTFGKHWNNQAVQLVDDGFVFNGMPLTITNNWHTDFNMTSSIIGDNNTVHIKGYATNGLKSVSLSLGVPEVGLKTNAESHIIVNVNSNYTSPAGYDIADIVHEQKEGLVNEDMTSASIDKVKCTSSDTAERCFDVTISFVIMAPLSHEVLAINAVDKQRYSTTTYINEGVEFVGEALLAAATHELKQKHGNQNPFETISLTQQDRRYQVWEDQYGYIWSQNDYGTWLQITRPDMQQRDDLPTSVMTRIHSNFANLVIDEQDRATLIFDSKAIQGTLDESFSYDMPLRLDRVSDPALLESLSIQEMLAQEMLCDCMIYDDSDLSWND